MDIPPYKNIYYWLAFAVSLFIFYLAYISTDAFPLTVTSQTGEVLTVPVEVFSRFLFNPLWVVVLFFIRKGQEQNSRHHRDILNYLKGVVFLAMDRHQDNVPTSTLAEVLVNSSDIESKIKKTLRTGVNMDSEGGNPVI